ncbi:MAG: redoxin domain-containing protein [Mucilaginibacter sp.]
MKKSGLALLGILLIQQSFAQSGKPFTLRGQFKGGSVDSVTLSYINAAGKQQNQTVAATPNGFTIIGTLAAPGNAYLSFKNRGEKLTNAQRQARSTSLYIDPGTIAAIVNPLNAADIKVSGSKTQAEMDELTALIAPIRDEEKPILDELAKEKDHEKASAIRDKLDPFQNRIKKVAYGFFLTHPNSYVTADQMRFYVGSMHLDSMERVYDNFNAELKASVRGKELEAEIKNMRSGSPGNMAPEFTRVDVNGKSLSLADFKGKYVMLDFWASWCVPCRAGNPHMIALYNQYKSKGLEIIGIADDDGKPDTWKGAISKDNVGIWHHVLRGLDWDLIRKGITNTNDLDTKYGIHSIPTKILIDPSGKIIGRFGDSIGGTDDDMDKMLAGVFK